MKHLILALTLILPLGVRAYDPEHLKRLKETNECPKCDLSEANLERVVLAQKNMFETNLLKANLILAMKGVGSRSYLYLVSHHCHRMCRPKERSQYR